jgi:hypothetical protein
MKDFEKLKNFFFMKKISATDATIATIIIEMNK